MGKTNIEWATHTWNPITGCTKVSEGCRHCYAERMVKRFGGTIHGFDSDGESSEFGRVICHPKKLDQPLHWRKPRRVFVNSMSDMFHDDVPDEFIAAVFGVMAASLDHTFIVLTKRPSRMVAWFRWLQDMAEQTADVNRETMRDLWTMHVMLSCARNYGSQVAGCRVNWPLPNVIGMVSVEDQPAADSRVSLLLESPFAIRGVSCEPMLGPIELRRGLWIPFYQTANEEPDEDPRGVGYPPESAYTKTGKLDWVICGGESGPGARPCEIRWIESIVGQCKEAGVPVFVKQLGADPRWSGAASMPIEHSRGKNADPEQWPVSLRVQEVPHA